MWELMGGGNYVLYDAEKKFFVSYQPNTGWFGIFAGDQRDETALVNPTDKKQYRILNGDFRKQYEPLIAQGWEACKKFFESQVEQHGSSWSD